MLAYQIKIAIKSLRRNPLLSALLIGGIALGIAVSTAFVTTYYMLASDPIPEKSDVLYYVQVDSWDPEDSWSDDHPEYAPNQLNYTDFMGLFDSDIPTYKVGSYKGSLTVQPDNDIEKPFQENIRMTTRDFFNAFDVPFQFGGGWGKTADEGPEPVVVIGAEMNRRLFGGENSVGETIRISNDDYAIVGVLDDWRPTLKFYDIHNNPFGEPEEIYMPFAFHRPMELFSSGNTSGWKFYPGNEYEDFLNSESIWIQYWVQLDDAQQREEFMSFMNAYVMEQKEFGRFPRPLNNYLLSPMEWLKVEEALPEEAKGMLIIAMLFLLVCSVNLIGILLGKFLARAPEVGVRRALGASKRAVFIQHLVECEVIGVIGGIAGIILSIGALELINKLFDNQFSFGLDLNMVIAGLVLSLGAGLIAGLYPAWRICRVAPAVHLKLQ